MRNTIAVLSLVALWGGARGAPTTGPTTTPTVATTTVQPTVAPATMAPTAGATNPTGGGPTPAPQGKSPGKPSSPPSPVSSPPVASPASAPSSTSSPTVAPTVATSSTTAPSGPRVISPGPPSYANDTILEIMGSVANLSLIYQAVSTLPLGQILNSSEINATVFAPIDEALTNITKDPSLKKFLNPAWTLHVENLFQYHTIEGLYYAENLTDGRNLTMSNNESLTVRNNGTDVVLVGEYFGNATVVLADLVASNGVVHEINNLMLPKFYYTDILTIATENSDFSTLVDLVSTAGLVETLKNFSGTLLAPVNAAFDDATVAKLKDSANKQLLTDTLLYHLIPSVKPTTLLADGDMLKTSLAGANVTVTVVNATNSSMYSFDGVEATSTNVLASNGIVHVLSKYLTAPVSVTAPTTPVASPVSKPVSVPVAKPVQMPTVPTKTSGTAPPRMTSAWWLGLAGMAALATAL